MSEDMRMLGNCQEADDGCGDIIVDIPPEIVWCAGASVRPLHFS